MQTIGPPKDNGTLDTILVQAEGKTGDQVERPALAQSEAEYRKQMGQVPEQDHAQKYDGADGRARESWKAFAATPNRPTATWP